MSEPDNIPWHSIPEAYYRLGLTPWKEYRQQQRSDNIRMYRHPEYQDRGTGRTTLTLVCAIVAASVTRSHVHLHFKTQAIERMYIQKARCWAQLLGIPPEFIHGRPTPGHDSCVVYVDHAVEELSNVHPSEVQSPTPEF